jgi:hypothetical protein
MLLSVFSVVNLQKEKQMQNIITPSENKNNGIEKEAN